MYIYIYSIMCYYNIIYGVIYNIRKHQNHQKSNTWQVKFGIIYIYIYMVNFLANLCIRICVYRYTHHYIEYRWPTRRQRMQYISIERIWEYIYICAFQGVYITNMCTCRYTFRSKSLFFHRMRCLQMSAPSRTAFKTSWPRIPPCLKRIVSFFRNLIAKRILLRGYSFVDTL